MDLNINVSLLNNEANFFESIKGIIATQHHLQQVLDKRINLLLVMRALEEFENFNMIIALTTDNDSAMTVYGRDIACTPIKPNVTLYYVVKVLAKNIYNVIEFEERNLLRSFKISNID
ncbi:hypothetical protein RIR_jg33456.t1 [Rhizophagus irregularis DAOM 181602=DAOM 197198]|nr:hypothetical protein RIR_jg33456.t1 [Rhizophagus irregularis DAOM 181602=DAOM 197198]